MRDQTVGLNLGDLQEGQRRHDALAHRDVLVLSPQRRVTHFTLHFAKYAGALVAVERTGNRTSMARIITDSLIIALACANSLGIDLARVLRQESADEPNNIADVLLRYAEIVGEMAKACEAFDHAHELYPSFDVLERAVSKLTRVILLCAAYEEVDLARSVSERWDAVEAKATNAAEETRNARQQSAAA